MEAPEKIFVTITHPLSDKYVEMIAFEHGDGIEYTRTDAFIDKIDGWFNTNFIFHDEYGIMSNQFDSIEEMIEDFKNYMKGE